MAAVDLALATEVRARRAKIAHLRHALEHHASRKAVLEEMERRDRRELMALLDAENSRAGNDVPLSDEEIGELPDHVQRRLHEEEPSTEELVQRAKQAEAAIPSALSLPAMTAAARRLDVYTLKELAGVLGVEVRKVTAAHAHLLEKGAAEALGTKYHGFQMYRYVAPEGEGAAAEVQREQRAAEPRPEDAVVAVASGANLERYPRPLRIQLRKALKAGFRLVEADGDGKPRLERDGARPITFGHTPEYPATEGRAIEKALRNLGVEDGLRPKRGEPVAGTGQPVGSSGKPGRDRAIARTGKRVKTKHGKA